LMSIYQQNKQSVQVAQKKGCFFYNSKRSLRLKQAPLFDTIKQASIILMIHCNLLYTGSMAGASVRFQQKRGS